MTPAVLLQTVAQALASDAGLVVLVLLILWMGARGVYVWKRVVDRLEAQLTDERVEFMGRLNEMREERDKWRAIALLLQGQRGPERPPPPNPLEGD
jgi:hypothetical protein